MPLPLIAAMGVGALAGGLTGAGVELAQKFDSDPSNDKFSWGSVAIGAAGGAALGGAGAALGAGATATVPAGRTVLGTQFARGATTRTAGMSAASKAATAGNVGATGANTYNANQTARATDDMRDVAYVDRMQATAPTFGQTSTAYGGYVS